MTQGGPQMDPTPHKLQSGPVDPKKISKWLQNDPKITSKDLEMILNEMISKWPLITSKLPQKMDED